MGIVWSWLGWTAREAASPLPAPLIPVLDDLRASQRALRARCVQKRRLAYDADIDMLELGLRMQQANNRLSKVDEAEFRCALQRKRMHVASHGELCRMLSNVDALIIRLEDAPTLHESFARVRAGVAVNARPDAQSLADEVQALRERLADDSWTRTLQSSVTAAIEQMTCEQAIDELDSLMSDSTFINQFKPEDIDAARRRLERLERAPAPPTDDPQRVANGDEALLGI